MGNSKQEVIMSDYRNYTIEQLLRFYRAGYIAILCGDKQEVLDIIFNAGEAS